MNNTKNEPATKETSSNYYEVQSKSYVCNMCEQKLYRLRMLHDNMLSTSGCVINVFFWDTFVISPWISHQSREQTSYPVSVGSGGSAATTQRPNNDFQGWKNHNLQHSNWWFIYICVVVHYEFIPPGSQRHNHCSPGALFMTFSSLWLLHLLQHWIQV